MSNPQRALRAALAPDVRPAIAAVTDGVMYFVLSYATIAVSCQLHNAAHPNNTITPAYGWLALTLGVCALFTGLVGAISATRAHERMMNRSALRTILGTIFMIALATGTACLLLMNFTDMTVTTRDVVQLIAASGLVVAPIGYRWFGTVPNPNVVSTVIETGDGTAPALGVSDDGSTLAVWTPDKK